MRTYQDLEELGQNEQARMDFIRQAVTSHQASEAYRIACDAEEYYAKKNVTIRKYQKTIMNALGKAINDIWSSNYKLTHGFFRMFVIQQVQYVLSNGVTFQQDSTKVKLGNNFDNQLQRLAKKALIDGVSFGFWNYDHLDVFCFADTEKDPGFCPLYDRDNGTLRAGIRYWSPTDKATRWTLYEVDGVTEYEQIKGDAMRVMQEKRRYMTTTTSTEACGVEDVEGKNYPGFPIIPFYANDLKESELTGIRSLLDAYDFIASGMANNIDETSAFYWVLKGSGGMDDVDLVQFVSRMKQLHAQVIPDGADAQANTINIPVEANESLLNRLKEDLYETAMLMNPAKALSGNMTATAIRLAYQQQDDRSGDFEFCVRDFITNLFCLLGIEDEPSFKWNRIANQTEETQMVMTAATYLDDEAVLNHLPWMTPEEVQELLKRKAAEDIDMALNNAPRGVNEDGEI